MKVEQIYEIVNTMSDEFLGEESVVKEDLSNVVDIGKAIFDVTNVDNYVKKLLDVIGRMVFVNERYRSKTVDILFDDWEFGSVVEKISVNMREAEINESWSLTDGETYNQDKFYAITANVTFFNHKVTFEIPCSFAEVQVKESFNNLNQLNSFYSMIETMIENSMTIKLDSLIMRTINNMIGQTLLADATAFTPEGETDVDYGTNSTLRAVNLLYLYNEQFGTSLKAEDALTTPEFARFTAYIMNLYVDRLERMSTKFNIAGLERFTEKENLRVVLLSELASAHKAYLQSDTYHESLVDLPSGYDTVPFWQGNGGDYSFANNSKIHIEVADANVEETGKSEIEIDGVLGIMFSKYACGVNQFNRRTTTHYNAKGEFFTNWAKTDANYFNALDEDFVVFFIADAPEESEETVGD